jgi:hypothetical protein
VAVYKSLIAQWKEKLIRKRLTFKSKLIFFFICVVLIFISLVFPFFLPVRNIQAASASIQITSPINGASVTSETFRVSLAYSDPGVFAETATWRIELPMTRVASLPEGPDDFVGSSLCYNGADYYNNRSGTTWYDVHPSTPGGKIEIYAVLKAWTSGGYSTVATDKIYVYYRPSQSGAAPAQTYDSPSGSTDSGSGGFLAVIFGGAVVVGGGLVLLVKKGVGKSKGPGIKNPAVGKAVYKEAETVEDAAAKLAEGRRNKALLDRFTKIRSIVWSDDRLLDFVDNARGSIVGKDGQINAENLSRLENTLKRWIARDKLAPQMPDYGGTEFYYDTVKQFSQNIVVRAGSAYLTAGYSEMAFNPISTLSNMRDNINQGDSTLAAVTKGYAWSSFELGLGESGRLLKYASPLLKRAKDSYNLSKLSTLNQDLSSEISTIHQLAGQADDAARYSRDAYMKGTEVVRVGEKAAAGMDHAEKLALELNNNPEFRKLLAENYNLVPSSVKEVMGLAKQKVYQQARDNAISDVMKQMTKEGVPTGENPFFINQTGTHAQPGNPGWNSLKSDFDHTVEFGSSKYNQLYEQRFNSHLESQGTSATAIDANVYGTGTSSRGAYSGGAMKFVEHYNSTSGSDIMVRARDGVVTVSRETPQASTSLLSKMSASDVKSAESNYQSFFAKDVAKGGSLENQIVNGSKTVSRNAGQYSAKYVENFQKTGSVKYQPPEAAKVADLIKKRGFSVDDAIKKVGYSGSKEQLLADYKNIMGAK